jgi:hypothetical protein
VSCLAALEIAHSSVKPVHASSVKQVHSGPGKLVHLTLRPPPRRSHADPGTGRASGPSR